MLSNEQRDKTMQVTKITVSPNFGNANIINQKRHSILDEIHDRTKNSSDMTDTIVVPRTIFKGYFGIMAGTTLATIGSFMTSKFPKTGKTISAAGLLTSLYGTWAFVRPFILKDAPGVEHHKEAQDAMTKSTGIS